MTSPKTLPRTTLALAFGLLVVLASLAPAAAQDAEPVADGPDAASSEESGYPGGLPAGAFGAGFDPVVPGIPDGVYDQPESSDGGGVSTSAPDPMAAGGGPGTIKTGAAARATGIHCFGRLVSIVGTPHNDRIYGTDHQDVIWAAGGNDIVSSGNANDFICGGGGRDQIFTLAGNDKGKGMEGPDVIFGGSGGDYLYGGRGDDTATGEAGQDFIWGDNGRDTLYGGFTEDAGDGEGGGGGLGQDSDDLIIGGPMNDVLIGGDLNDTMQGQGGNDTLDGDAVVSTDSDGAPSGYDDMTGGPGRDRFDGGPGNDTATGGSGDDIFSGGDDHDTLWGDGGLDWINGDAGLDTIHGGDDWDTLNGGGEGDALHGDGGSDTLCGGDGVNTLYGGDQGDFLSGDADGCTFSFANLLDTMATDNDVANLNDGGPGADLCVSPSAALSPQTVRCEFDGFLRLVVVVSGGNGNVTLTDGPIGVLNEFGIDCSEPPASNVCEMFFLPSELPVALELTATPAVGYTFQGWNGVPGGQCPGVTNPCLPIPPGMVLTATDFINNTRTITATFVATNYTVSIVKSGAGAGAATVTSNVGSINCGGTCSGSIPAGSSVTFTVTGGVVVNSWTLPAGIVATSPCGAGDFTCTATVDASGTITVDTT